MGAVGRHWFPKTLSEPQFPHCTTSEVLSITDKYLLSAYDILDKSLPESSSQYRLNLRQAGVMQGAEPVIFTLNTLCS